MTVLLTGATGAIGRRMLGKLETPRALVRDPRKIPGSFAWSAARPVPPAAMEGVQAIVHLAGEPVAQRWTEESKKRIRDSRVEGTARIVDAIRSAPEKPRVLVSASAVGIYGTRDDERLDEESPAGQGFLADVCREWEQAASMATELGVRVVHLRIGVVLARGEGFLGKLVPLFRLGLGGRVGDGSQFIPWVHVDDVTGLILHALSHDSVRGPINATSPDPQTNRALVKTLAHVLHRPALLPAPEFAVRAAFGELASVVLASQRVFPKVAEASGYRFQFPDLEPALRKETE